MRAFLAGPPTLQRGKNVLERRFLAWSPSDLLSSPVTVFPRCWEIRMCVDITGFVLFLGQAWPLRCWRHESVIVPAGRGRRHASEAQLGLA